MSQFPYFPWRLFWKSFSSLVLLLNVLFLGALSAASYVFDFSFVSAPPLLLLLCYFIVSCGAAAIYSYRSVTPLRGVILKALRLANKKYVNEFEEEDVLIDEPGEYLELEQALDKIRKKLQKRRLQLSHEREEIQTLMSSMEEAIVSVDLEQKLVFFNSQFAAQFLTSQLLQSRQQGQKIALVDCLREPQVLELFSDAISKGDSRSHQIKLLNQLEGAVHLETNMRHFSVRVSPLREEKTRTIYGALAVFHDITELKKAEQIRIEFVENASHELRTPLTSIKGFVHTLREDMTNGRLEQAPQFLDIISKSVDRLTELVNDMLTISTLESSSPLDLEMINPALVTEDVVARLSGLAIEKHIMIKVHYEAPEFKGDVHKIEQVLFNLIGNAIKYIPPGGQIEVRWDRPETHQIRLRVVDNGPGIAKEHQARLFERFYRVDKGRSRDIGGTGLGLSIVKHIMQSHGGSVAVKSEAGQGAEFTCFFPWREGMVGAQGSLRL